MKQYQFHPLANIFPLADEGTEFEALVEDIRRNGLHQPIILHEEMILDGRRRYLACKKAGVSPNFLAWNGIGLAIDFVISANALRRHLSASQLAIAALKSLPFFEQAAKERQRLSNGRAKKVAQSCATLTGKAAEWVAKRFGISVRMVEMAKAVQVARPKMVAEIDTGRISVSEAYSSVANPESESTNGNQWSKSSTVGIVGLADRGSVNEVRASCDDSLEDRFQTPRWLFDALNNDYGFRLDACAEKEVAKCADFFCPKQDALRQGWSKFGSVFCNPPYNWHRLERWVVKGFHEAQKGATVVMLLPYFKSYSWFRYVVIPFAEIRQIQGLVIYPGYGSQKGRCAGNRGARPFDSIVAVFRKGQQGFNGTYVDKAGQKPPAPPKSLGRHFWNARPMCGGSAKRKAA